MDTYLESNMETSKEKLLESSINSSMDGFVSYAGLLGFEDELELLKKYEIHNRIVKKLERWAVRNTLENLYAMGESAIKTDEVDDMGDFHKYNLEALEVVKKYEYNVDVQEKFDKIKSNARVRR